MPRKRPSRSASPDRQPASPDDASKRPVLQRLAQEESRGWVERLGAQLEADGREICGGWPGTISEARRLLAARLTLEGRSRAFAMNASELEGTVQAIYLAAKREWLSRAPRA